MKNKDMLVAALNCAIDDGGDTLKETIDHLIRCPYMSAYSLISYGHAHPLCADQDGTASRDRCAACISIVSTASVRSAATKCW